MIGTHNSLTYLESKNSWLRIFSFLWKCQDYDIDTQINCGVRFFDLRVRFNSKGELLFCHGLVDLDYKYNLIYLLNKLECNNCKCRIILERGENLGIMKEIPREYLGTIVYSVILKKNWKVLYQLDNLPSFVDYCYKPILSNKSFWWNLKHFKFSTIYRWSLTHNKETTKKMITEETIHFMDYYGILDYKPNLIKLTNE